MSLRLRSTSTLVALVLLVSAVAGWTASHLAERHRGLLESARTLARTGRLVEAEHAYLELARQRPVSVPLLVELLDNHKRLVSLTMLPMVSSGSNAAVPTREPMLFEEATIDALLSAPDLTPDQARLGRYWRAVTRSEVSQSDREAVTRRADADPPEPWYNHILGLEAQELDDDAGAGERFAREASSFDDRNEDAAAACHIWLDDGNWARLSDALGRPRFAKQVPMAVRLRDALRRHDWFAVARWFVPAQWEGASPGVVWLVAVSGLVWFAMCAGIGRIIQRWRVRIPLYALAIGLGVASTFVALAVDLIEEGTLGLTEKGMPVADAIYFVVGVALREELAKALFLLPLALLVVRIGKRREAFACGALVGLGFAAEENLDYFHMGLSTALARFLTANVLHVSTTALVALALDDHLRGRESRPGELSRILMLVILIHGLYDFFLSSASVDRGSFLSMFTFVLLTRRFVDGIRSLGGSEGPLVQRFCVGLAIVAGASFIYAAVRVGPEQAAMAILQGALGLAIVIYVLIQQLRTA
jgi:RsiW-degrading membrane proteinase PrsW (M82 family)